MIVVNTHEAKTKLSALLRLIEEQGEHVQICRNGRPVAELCPITSPTNPLIQNPRLTAVEFREDPTTPLTHEDWPEEQR